MGVPASATSVTGGDEDDVTAALEDPATTALLAPAALLDPPEGEGPLDPAVALEGTSTMEVATDVEAAPEDAGPPLGGPERAEEGEWDALVPREEDSDPWSEDDMTTPAPLEDGGDSCAWHAPSTHTWPSPQSAAVSHSGLVGSTGQPGKTATSSRQQRRWRVFMMDLTPSSGE
jgi:hypothetical protein